MLSVETERESIETRERIARSEARTDVLERDQVMLRQTVHDLAGNMQRSDATIAGINKTLESVSTSLDRIERAVEGQRSDLSAHRNEATASVSAIMVKFDEGLSRLHARVDRLVQATLVAFAVGMLTIIGWLLTHPLPWAQH